MSRSYMYIDFQFVRLLFVFVCLLGLCKHYTCMSIVIGSCWHHSMVCYNMQVQSHLVHTCSLLVTLLQGQEQLVEHPPHILLLHVPPA